MTQELEAARPLRKPNGVAPHAPAAAVLADGPAEDARYSAFRRPYIVESESFANRLQVELDYADNELGMIRANITALQHRERDLMKIRDAALNGLGTIKQEQEEQ
jgi:hypothetical protein